MTRYDPEFFQRIKFTADQIGRYMANARRDLEIARKDKFSEVRFTYAYQAVIKGGIALIAKDGSMKVRSVPGHHIKILEKTSEILKDEEILSLGNQMRMKRNTDLYGGGAVITEADAAAFVRFAGEVVAKVAAVVTRIRKPNGRSKHA